MDQIPLYLPHSEYMLFAADLCDVVHRQVHTHTERQPTKQQEFNISICQGKGLNFFCCRERERKKENDG